MAHLRFELISESHPCSTSFFDQKVSNQLEVLNSSCVSSLMKPTRYEDICIKHRVRLLLQAKH